MRTTTPQILFSEQVDRKQQCEAIAAASSQTPHPAHLLLHTLGLLLDMIRLQLFLTLQHRWQLALYIQTQSYCRAPQDHRAAMFLTVKPKEVSDHSADGRAQLWGQQWPKHCSVGKASSGLPTAACRDALFQHIVCTDHQVPSQCEYCLLWIAKEI